LLKKIKVCANTGPCESYDFTISNCLIYIKSRKYGKEIGEKSGQQNREKSELSHIVSIDTAFAPENVGMTYIIFIYLHLFVIVTLLLVQLNS